MTDLIDLQIDEARFQRLVSLAYEEDLGHRGDVTSLAVSGQRPVADLQRTAELIARSDGVICGLAIVPVIVGWAPPTTGLHSSTRFEPCRVLDGDAVHAGTVLGTLRGDHSAILAVERTMLNFLQRLSGVATMTRGFVDAVAGTSAKIYDTRKTTPGWRDLEKYAVRCGGGHNHRRGLHDAILVKDNHLAGIKPKCLAGAAFEILNRAADLKLRPAFVEFEVDTLDQFEQLLKVVGIDVLLLDNLSVEDLAAAVRRRDELGLKGKLELEASGGVTLETVHAVAQTGVDRISVGALTHSAVALDISLHL